MQKKTYFNFALDLQGWRSYRIMFLFLPLKQLLRMASEFNLFFSSHWYSWLVEDDTSSFFFNQISDWKVQHLSKRKGPVCECRSSHNTREKIWFSWSKWVSFYLICHAVRNRYAIFILTITLLTRLWQWYSRFSRVTCFIIFLLNLYKSLINLAPFHDRKSHYQPIGG